MNKENSAFKPLLLLVSETEPFTCLDIGLEGEGETALNSMAEVLKRIRERGIEILSSKGNYRLEGGAFEADFLVAVKGGEKEASQIAEDLKTIRGVSHSSISDKFGRICYSKRLFPIDVFGLRWILMGPANYEALLLGMKKILGTQIYPLAFRKLGNQIGKNIYEYYIKSMGKVESFDFAMSFLSMIITISGWGIVEHWGVTQNGIEIVFRDYWEVQLFQAKMVEDKPRLLIGLLEGFFEDLLRREVSADVLSVEKEGKSIKTRAFVRFT
ncbi:MAG: hypothetical protein ACPLZ8_04440 [Fervidicoccaceae archaeon]